MDRKIWTILLSIALLVCLFLPISNVGKSSAFDIFKNGMGGIWQNYIWLLIPVAALLLLIGALNNGSYFLSRGFLTLLPFLAILFILVIWPLMESVKLDFGAMIKGFGIGMWGLVIVSILLAFIHPRQR
jgi:asparagine N-glycosylation enzyme membrane subunit Stt3